MGWLFGSITPPEVEKILVEELDVTVRRLPRAVQKQLASGHAEVLSAGGNAYDSAIHYAGFVLAHLAADSEICRLRSACQRIVGKARLQDTKDLVFRMDRIQGM